MFGEIAFGSEFFVRLHELDRQIGQRAAAAGCARCAGRLHRSDYVNRGRGAKKKLDIRKPFVFPFHRAVNRHRSAVAPTPAARARARRAGRILPDHGRPLVATLGLMDLTNPCTRLCEQAAAIPPERGEPLRFTLAADGSPLAAVLWADGEAHPLTGPVTIIGRRPAVADVQLDDSSVSRRAAVLRICPHGVTLEDFGSGTWVSLNDQRVGDGARVFAGDEIRIGRFIVRIAERP